MKLYINKLFLSLKFVKKYYKLAFKDYNQKNIFLA